LFGRRAVYLHRTDSPSRDSKIHHREIRTRRLARCVLWRDFPKLTSPSEAPLSAFLAPVALQDRQTVLWLHLLFFVRGTIHIGHVHLLVTTCQEGWRIKLTSNRAVRLRGNAALPPPTAPRRGPPSPAGRSRRSERRMGLVLWHFCDNQRRLEASPLFGPEAEGRGPPRFRYDVLQADALLIKRLSN
jgi:hypothetical protein